MSPAACPLSLGRWKGDALRLVPQAEASPPLSLPPSGTWEPGFRLWSPSTSSAVDTRVWARCGSRRRASLSRTRLCLGAYAVCPRPAAREGASCSCASPAGSPLQGPACSLHAGALPGPLGAGPVELPSWLCEAGPRRPASLPGRAASAPCREERMAEVPGGRGRARPSAPRRRCRQRPGLCVLVVGLLPQGVFGPGPGLVMLRVSSEATGGGLVLCWSRARMCACGCGPFSHLGSHTGLRPSVHPSGRPSLTC